MNNMPKRSNQGTRRDDFLRPVIEVLAKRAGQQCSNPGCRLVTSGPHSSASKSVTIGVAAHISAASLGGKRYDPNMTSDERKSIDNGIWLCQNCAKLIDSDEKTFTVEVLKTWKLEHENEIRHNMLHSTKNILDSAMLRSLPLSKFPNKSRLNPNLRVQVTTNSENLPIYSHISTSSSDPISVLFKIINTSQSVVDYLQIR